MMSLIDRMPGQGQPIPGGIRLWSLDTNALKDAFWSRVESGRVHLHADTEEDFASHSPPRPRSGTKGAVGSGLSRGGRPTITWIRSSMPLAMADPECWGGVMVLPKPEPAKASAPEDGGEMNPFTGKPKGSFWK